MKKFTIEAPEGQMINEAKLKDGIIEFIPECKQFPNKWELEKDKTYYFINNLSEIEDMTISDVHDCISSANTNCLPTEELAMAMLSFIKLITMRERYRDGSNYYPWIIYAYNKKKEIGDVGGGDMMLSFQSSKIRDLFSENFNEDIMICINAGLI